MELSSSEADAGGRPVSADDPQRQTQHVVNARLHLAEVQALDDDGAAAEQHMMGRGTRRLEFLDRKVVDPDDLDPAGDQMLGARSGDADVVRVELGRSPQARVRGLEQDAELLRQVEARQLLGANPVARADLDDTGTAEHHLERQGVGAGRVVEEVARRIDVRAGMCTQMQRGDIRAVAPSDALDGFDRKRGVAGVRGEAWRPRAR